jgi:hypothetical protein
MTKTELRDALAYNDRRRTAQYRIIEDAQRKLAELDAERATLEATVPVAKPRLDTLPAGTRVTLALHGWAGSVEYMTQTFVGITGAGDERRATFNDEMTGDWDAYRYEGGWAYGSSAQRLQLLEVQV